MKAKDSYEYNLWLSEVSKDPLASCYFLGEERPVRKVRTVMDTCFGIAGISLIVLLMALNHVFSAAGILHVVLTVVAVLCAAVGASAALFEFRAANALRTAWKESKRESIILSDEELQDEARRKMQLEYAEKLNRKGLTHFRKK